ncbi:MAG: hypothetical protein Kow00127_16570 [Bacteroidales bacterium]
MNTDQTSNTMKTFKSFLFAILLVFTAHTLTAGTTWITTKKGKTIQVVTVVEGAVSLYCETTEHGTFDTENPAGPTIVKSKIYYVKYGENNPAQKITPSNYKRILKEIIASGHEVREKLGTPGYRFADLESIVQMINC